jgi:hypothetical protein
VSRLLIIIPSCSILFSNLIASFIKELGMTKYENTSTEKLSIESFGASKKGILLVIKSILSLSIRGLNFKKHGITAVLSAFQHR